MATAHTLWIGCYPPPPSPAAAPDPPLPRPHDLPPCSAAGTYKPADDLTVDPAVINSCTACAIGTYRAGDATPENNVCKPIPAGARREGGGTGCQLRCGSSCGVMPQAWYGGGGGGSGVQLHRAGAGAMQGPAPAHPRSACLCFSFILALINC